MVTMEHQGSHARRGFKRSSHGNPLEVTKRAVMQKQLSIISERSDHDVLIDEEPFDVDSILRHLSSFSSDDHPNLTTNSEDTDNNSAQKEAESLEDVENVLSEAVKDVVVDRTRKNIKNCYDLRRTSDTSGIRQTQMKRQNGELNSLHRENSLGKKGRLSLPNIRQCSSNSLMGEASSDKFDKLPGEWRNVFYSLDKKDGHKDGRLHKKSLKNILNTLETNSTWSLEYKTGQFGARIERQISQADKDKNGYLDKDEFAELVMHLDIPGEGRAAQVNHVMTGHMKTAAYAGECRLCPPPLFILLVSLLQLGCFLYHCFHLAAEQGQAMHWDGPAPLCSVLIFDPALRWQAWRFLSYSLVHSGYSHLLLNLIMQLGVGLPLECSQGTIRTALVYMMGVLGGSLATTCLDPRVYLAGASGGVYSLILAHLSTLILNWKEDVLIVRPKVFRKRGQEDKTAEATHGTLIRLLKLTAVSAFTLVDTSMAVYNKHVYSDTNTTGYTAHIAGAVAGLVVGFCALENRRVQSWEVKLKVASFTLVACLLGAAVLWNIYGDLWYSHLRQGELYFLKSRTAQKPERCEADNLFSSFS